MIKRSFLDVSPPQKVANKIPAALRTLDSFRIGMLSVIANHTEDYIGNCQLNERLSMTRFGNVAAKY